MNHEAIHAELSTIATEYNHSVQQQSLLETYKDPILLLRAKYASYEKITELLQAKGIKVSVATVRKFCRKYQADAKRLRSELEGRPASATENEHQPPQDETPTPTGREQRPPLTTEPGKRGPRTARDTL
jgi:hypothetical protein